MTALAPVWIRLQAALASILLAFLALSAFATPASAQLTGGLEGIILHHTFERVAKSGNLEFVAEAWLDRKSGDLWVRGRMAPGTLTGSLVMRSQVSEVGPPPDALRLSPAVAEVAQPAWLKHGHLWSRPDDGVVATAVKLVLEPGCTRRCAVVAIEHYQLPGGGMAGSGFNKLIGVDLWPVEPGDVRTVYAER